MKFNIICISVAIGLLSNSIQAAPIANNAVTDTKDYAQKLTHDVTPESPLARRQATGNPVNIVSQLIKCTLDILKLGKTPVGAAPFVGDTASPETAPPVGGAAGPETAPPTGDSSMKRDGSGETLDLNNLGKRGGILGGIGGGDNVVGEETTVGSGGDLLGGVLDLDTLLSGLKKRGDDLLGGDLLGHVPIAGDLLDNLDIDLLKKRQLGGATSGLTDPVTGTLDQLKLAETANNIVGFATNGPLDTSAVTDLVGVKRSPKKSHDDDDASAVTTTDVADADADAATDKKKKQDGKSDKSDKSTTNKDDQSADAEEPTDVDVN